MPDLELTSLMADLIASATVSDINAEEPPSWAHAGQRAVMEATETDIIALCAVQSGKTAIQPYWLLSETHKCRHFIRASKRHGNALFAGPSQTLAEAQAIPSFRQLWESELKLGKWYSSPKPKFVLSKDGARRLLGSAETEVTIHFPYASDSANIESVTAYACTWDEMGQPSNKLSSYHAIVDGRLVIARQNGFGRMLAGTTPYEWNWLKSMVDTVIGENGELLMPIFPDSDVRKASNGRVAVINWPSWLHPSMTKEFVMDRLNVDGLAYDVWSMRYLGLYTKPAGAIYDCWNADTHELNPNNFPKGIPAWWDRFIGLDFGLNNTAAVFLAKEEVDYTKKSAPTGRYILYGEYLDGNKTTEEHVRAILKMAGGTRRPLSVGGNHAEEQIRDAFRLSGLPVQEPRYTDVESQVISLYSAIKSGNLVALTSCRGWSSEMNSLSWQLGDEMQPTRKIKDEAKYHRHAAMRYLATFLFKNMSPIDPTKKPMKRFDASGVQRVV